MEDRIRAILIPLFAALLLVVAINCDDDEAAKPCDPAVLSTCGTLFMYCDATTRTCTGCAKPYLDCDKKSLNKCEEQAPSGVCPTGKACVSGTTTIQCKPEQCCDQVTTPGTPNCRNANEACGVSQYCHGTQKQCIANKMCNSIKCNPPSCCDTTANPQECVTQNSPCPGTPGHTCKSTGICSGGSGTQCGSNTCTTGQCCDNNTNCVNNGAPCPLQKGTCSNGTCSTTGGSCTENQKDSCKSDVQHCVGTTCHSCVAPAKNCDRDDDDDCECPNGCKPEDPTACADASTTTLCPSFGGTGSVTCNTATQMCVIFEETMVEARYECKNVPSECTMTANRNCVCMKEYVCPGWGCTDSTTMTNTLTCSL